MSRAASGRDGPASASPPLAGILRRARQAHERGDIGAAVRELDRAWRCLPEEAPTLAPRYAQLLAFEDRDWVAALRMLARALQFGPDPELEALSVRGELRLGNFRQARQRLEEALGRFCVAPGDLLSAVAWQAVCDGRLAAAGWVGLTANLEFVWQLRSGLDASAMRIRVAGRDLPAASARTVRASPDRIFCWKPPEELAGERFDFVAGGVPLAGSGGSARPDFALDGRSDAAGQALSGWARLGWAPAQPLELCIEDDDGQRAWVRTRAPSDAQHRWPFALDLRRSALGGGRLRISARLPDARLQALPDSPLLLEAAVRLPASDRHTARRWAAVSRTRRAPRPGGRRPAAIDVIVPVYRAREETLACLQSVLATIGAPAGRAPARAAQGTRAVAQLTGQLIAQLIVVDDASDDPALAAALDGLAAAGRILLLRNESNQGFVASVNRALALRPTHDAVLLNSDALVYGNWLERLRAAAYREPSVGTVTPFTNEGSIASYPDGMEHVTAGQAAALGAIAAEVHDGASVEIPVGVGHCLYLRRDCLRDVGAFDQAAFGTGYGEETDFALRARVHGWTHRLAADVFVFHAGGRSFAARRAALLDRSQRLLNLRHPGYDEFIGSYLAADPLQGLRRNLDERRLASFDGSFVLFITLALTGGVDKFVAQRCRELRAQGRFPLVLRPAQGEGPRRVELWTDALALPNLRYAIPAELAALRQCLRALRIDHIELQHFLGLDPRVVDVGFSLGRPYDVFLHDYAWICPRVTLIGASGRYCGEPALSACEDCIRKCGSRLDEPITVAGLRQRSGKWLQGARVVYTSSADAAQRYRRYFTQLPIQVQPYGPALAADLQPGDAGAGQVVRVALVGAIGEHKGYRVLLDCARDAARRKLPLQFVVIGYTQDDAALARTGKVFVTGRYSEGEAAHLLARERPHLAFMPSVWPETWCYALDHVVKAGLPVVAFDLGAIAERLRAAGLGILLALNSNVRRINDCFLQMAAGKKKVLANMATPETRRLDQEAEGLSASVQVLPLPAGLYLFSVRAAAPSLATAAGNVALPAIHVSLGPGVRDEQVEFVSGPATKGPWLFAQGDMLVARVGGSGATLVLTSIRAPGGETLSISVERLEGRADGETAQPASHKPAAVHSAGAAPPVAGGAPVQGAGLPLQISAHIRARGDRKFINVAWAGRAGPGMWIESFSVLPMETLGAADVEYKALTANGFETPWTSDDLMCGTKGMAVPLIGFAARLKGDQAARFDCEYSGYFQSGTVSGPCRNGAPCRSTVANDPLEGIQLRVLARPSRRVGPAVPKPVRQPVKRATKAGAGEVARPIGKSRRA